MENKRKLYVFVPVEVDLYDSDGEKDVVGSIRTPTVAEIKKARGVCHHTFDSFETALKELTFIENLLDDEDDDLYN